MACEKFMSQSTMFQKRTSIKFWNNFNECDSVSVISNLASYVEDQKLFGYDLYQKQ